MKMIYIKKNKILKKMERITLILMNSNYWYKKILIKNHDITVITMIIKNEKKSHKNNKRKKIERSIQI